MQRAYHLRLNLECDCQQNKLGTASQFRRTCHITNDWTSVVRAYGTASFSHAILPSGY